MLYGSLQPFLEEDGILDKETVDVCTAKEAHVVVHTRIAEIDVLVGLLRTPGGIKKNLPYLSLARKPAFHRR